MINMWFWYNKFTGTWRKPLVAYIITFIVLTLVAYNFFNIGWYGFKFSLPILGVALLIDLFLTYNKYKKWLKN